LQGGSGQGFTDLIDRTSSEETLLELELNFRLDEDSFENFDGFSDHFGP
jgi:hypothetical protein